MSTNQHYSSETTPWWSTAQQQHPYQTMLIQSTHNPASSPSNYSCPPHLYHTHQASFNSFNSSHDPHTSSSSHHRYRATSPFNLNIEEEEEEDADDYTHNPCTQQDEYDPEREGAVHERKPMFEKPLTPSDVGKLNRLVIPKQHAEKYFPLSGESAQQKGLLLSFEDESGKCWKFRYSYWNSSQSYVLTKGWSRYVKEKRLDAGDIVLFEKDANDGHRLFIGWRRRRQERDQSAGAHVGQAAGHSWHNNNNNNMNMNVGNGGGGGGGGVDMGWTRVIYSAQPYPTHQASPLSQQPECLPAGKEVSSQTTTSMGSSSKVLRLFGVNMECQSDGSEPSTPSGSSMSSHALNLHHYYHHHQASNYLSQTTPHDHMDMMRSHRG